MFDIVRTVTNVCSNYAIKNLDYSYIVEIVKFKKFIVIQFNNYDDTKISVNHEDYIKSRNIISKSYNYLNIAFKLPILNPINTELILNDIYINIKYSQLWLKLMYLNKYLNNYREDLSYLLLYVFNYCKPVIF
jgi:hypothetical protein